MSRFSNSLTVPAPDGGRPRILVLRGGAIGDLILTLPALQALRNQWPESYIELIGYPHIANLALACGLADCITSMDKAEIARYFSFKSAISPEQVSYLKSFDVIISYLYDPDGIVRSNMKRAGARHVIYGSPLVHSGHAIDHLMQPLVELAIFGCGTEAPQLRLSAPCLERGKTLIDGIGRKVLAIHPGSGSPKKNWPIENFLTLAARVKKETDLTPMFIIGEADHSIKTALQRIGSVVPVMSGYSLVDLAAAMRFCLGYVGNDSGVTHIAAALGIPVVALFGPTDPQVWGPRGPKTRVIRGTPTDSGGVLGISVEEVFNAVGEVVPDNESDCL